MGRRHGGSDGRPSAWERYAWVAGILFVIALVAEIVAAVGVELSQNDSAAKIANGLHAHETRLIVVACLSVVYAVMFVISRLSRFCALDLILISPSPSVSVGAVAPPR